MKRRKQIERTIPVNSPEVPAPHHPTKARSKVLHEEAMRKYAVLRQWAAKK